MRGTRRPWAATAVLITCSHKPQEGQDQERGSTGEDAQGEAEQRGEQDGGPAQEVEQRPGPPGRLDLLPGEHALLRVHLLQRVLEAGEKGWARRAALRQDVHSGAASDTAAA